MKRNTDLVVRVSTKSLIVAMETGNKMQIMDLLKNFKLSNGAVNYVAIAGIPIEHRISNLAKENFSRTIAVITVALSMCFESMNMRRLINDSQILDLAEAIIDSSSEDQLAVEDLMLFVQNLTRGKYGAMYESMDIPKFMEKLDIYREERFREVMNWKHNKHLEYKNLGDPERANRPMTDFDQHLADYTNKVQKKNDEIKALRSERKKNFDMDNF